MEVGDSFTFALSQTSTASAVLDTINKLDARVEYIASLTNQDGALAIIQSENTIEGTVYLTATGLEIKATNGSGSAQLKTIDNFMCGGIPPPTFEQANLTNTRAASQRRITNFSTFSNGLPRLNSSNEPWVLYLDFDGATLKNTIWNSFAKLNTINLAPMNRSGSANTFDELEQRIIIDAYSRIVDSYSPYRVNVTTDVAKYNQASASRRGRIIFTPTEGWLPVNFQSFGGLAFHDTFGKITPSLVFPHRFSNGINMGLSAAHEAGHMFNLEHVGLNGEDYHPGQILGWGPIMGKSYQSAYTTWSKGDYLGATNFEDDLSIISTYIPFISDTQGNKLSEASLVNDEKATVVSTIHQNDSDFFSFNAKKGQRITIDIEALTLYPMLNSELTLYDASGKVVKRDNPPPSSARPRYANHELDSSIKYEIPKTGGYYFAVRGAGYNGGFDYQFSAYGAVGKYILNFQKIDRDEDDFLMLIIPILKKNDEN